MVHYPCGTCQTKVTDNDNSILCDLCEKWHHTICVNVSNINYEKFKVDPNPWLCPTCAEEIPFFDLANKDLKNLLSNSFPEKSILKKVDQKTKIHLEKFKELNQVLNKTENNISCGYFDIDEFKKLKQNSMTFDKSVFIERLFPNKPTFVTGTIYKHPTMQNYKFNIEFMENLLNKIK